MAKLGKRKSFLSHYPENIAGNVTFSALLSPALSFPSVHQSSKETFNDSILLGSHDPWFVFLPHHPPFPTTNTPPCHCFKLLNNSLFFSSPVTIGYLDYFQSFALQITFKKIVLLQGCCLPCRATVGPTRWLYWRLFISDDAFPLLMGTKHPSLWEQMTLFLMLTLNVSLFCFVIFLLSVISNPMTCYFSFPTERHPHTLDLLNSWI